MGCPPDPFDVSLSRYSDESEALGRTAEKLLSELEKLHPVLTAVSREMPLGLSGDFLKDCGKLIGRLEAVQPKDIARRFSWADVPTVHGPNDYPDLSAVYGHVQGAKMQVRAAEMTLCELRDRLLKAWARVPAGKRTGDLAASVAAETEAHRLHRLDDRRVYLEALSKSVELSRYKIQADDTTAEEKRIEALQLSMLEQERKRVLAFTDEELLADRTLFFSLPELPPKPEEEPPPKA